MHSQNKRGGPWLSFDGTIASGSKREKRTAPHILLVTAMAVMACASCSHLTVAPTPVAPHQVSTWAQTNIIAADANGILVTAEFVRVYHNLLKVYGAKLAVSSQPATPDDGIRAEGDKFRISYVVQSRFADLKFIERNSSSP